MLDGRARQCSLTRRLTNGFRARWAGQLRGRPSTLTVAFSSQTTASGLLFAPGKRQEEGTGIDQSLSTFTNEARRSSVLLFDDQMPITCGRCISFRSIQVGYERLNGRIRQYHDTSFTTYQSYMC